MALLMGIDVGTTRVKTLLFDLDSRIVGQASQDCSLYQVGENQFEQDVEDLWRAVLSTAREAVAQAGPGAQVLGLSLASQAGALALVDAEGRSLRRAFAWMDGRGATVLKDLQAALDPEEVRRFSGWRLSGGSVLAHIEWLRRFEPPNYEAARYFLQVNDFIIYRLVGQPYQDPSNAGYSTLYNIMESCWEPRALAAVGITAERLPPVAPSGQRVGLLRADVAREMGLSGEVWVMNGAHDQYAAALGAGVIEPGHVLLSCGTAWVVLVVSAEPAWGPGPAQMAVSRHAVPDRWGALRSMGPVGTTVEWYVDTVLAPHGGHRPGTRCHAFEFMNQQLPQVPIGARGLFFFPLGRGGARTKGGRGALWGLTTRHGQADIGRAVLEGITFELRQLIEGMRSVPIPIASLVMVGGAARSSCWPQIVADVTGLPVTVPAVQEAGARGAALLAGIGLGLLSPREGLQEGCGVDQTFEPQREDARAYADLYPRYQAAADAYIRLEAFHGINDPQ